MNRIILGFVQSFNHQIFERNSPWKIQASRPVIKSFSHISKTVKRPLCIFSAFVNHQERLAKTIWVALRHTFKFAEHKDVLSLTELFHIHKSHSEIDRLEQNEKKRRKIKHKNRLYGNTKIILFEALPFF